MRAANRDLEAAATIHPLEFTYTTRNGDFTAESVKEWRRRTDECIAAYKEVLAAIEHAEREDKARQRLGYPRQLDRGGVKDPRERVKIEMNRLAADRNRKGV